MDRSIDRSIDRGGSALSRGTNACSSGAERKEERRGERPTYLSLCSSAYLLSSMCELCFVCSRHPSSGQDWMPTGTGPRSRSFSMLPELDVVNFMRTRPPYRSRSQLRFACLSGGGMIRGGKAKRRPPPPPPTASRGKRNGITSSGVSRRSVAFFCRRERSVRLRGGEDSCEGKKVF